MFNASRRTWDAAELRLLWTGGASCDRTVAAFFLVVAGCASFLDGTAERWIDAVSLEAFLLGEGYGREFALDEASMSGPLRAPSAFL